MRIGINTLSIIPGSMGGAETYMYNLLRELAACDQSNEYLVFVSKNNRGRFTNLSGSFHLVLVPGDMLIRPWRILMEHTWLPRLIRQEKVDILFCPSDSLPARLDCNSVVTVQNLLYFHFHEFYRRLSCSWRSRARVWSQYAYYKVVTPRTLREATRIVTVSYHAAIEIQQYTKVPDGKIRVVYHGVGDMFKPWPKDRKQFFHKANPWIPELFILYLGALSPYKNLDRLIEAFYVLKRKYNVSHKLVLVGGDPIGLGLHLKAMAESLGVGQDVIIRPYMNHNYVSGLYNLASCLCLLSSCESFGLPVVEAMACSTPVVAANRSSLPEIVGDAGLLVDPDDVEGVAEALHQVVTDTAVSLSLAQRGKARVQRFSWRNAALQMITIFEELGNH